MSTTTSWLSPSSNDSIGEYLELLLVLLWFLESRFISELVALILFGLGRMRRFGPCGRLLLSFLVSDLWSLTYGRL